MPQSTVTETPKPASGCQSKRYDEAFKRQAVENWTGSAPASPAPRSPATWACLPPSLKDWERRYGGDATPQRADLEAENRALRAELARVREQRDILKKSGHPLRTIEDRCPAA